MFRQVQAAAQRARLLPERYGSMPALALMGVLLLALMPSSPPAMPPSTVRWRESWVARGMVFPPRAQKICVLLRHANAGSAF